jgi:hypothetical protein
MTLDDEEYIVFDPDCELEWEIGLDREIIFEPDQGDQVNE